MGQVNVVYEKAPKRVILRGWWVTVLVVVFVAVAALLGSAVALGLATWMLLHEGFWTGWHAAWGNPLMALLWTALAGPASGYISGRRRERERQARRNPFAGLG